MDMNREAVDFALALAGNQPLTDEDKRNRNSVYLLLKSLYLNCLFASLGEIDWKCAQKRTALHPSTAWAVPRGGEHRYDAPADLVKPLQVDDNSVSFRHVQDWIITEYPAGTLLYVFHNRKADGLAIAADPRGEPTQGRQWSVRADSHPSEAGDPAGLFRASPRALPDAGEDFPEWEYTPYDSDFWQYFSYKLAARLVPRLRADDGAAQRAQALDALAVQKGEEAIQRSRGGATNEAQPSRLWAEAAGLRTSYREGLHGR